MVCYWAALKLDDMTRPARCLKVYIFGCGFRLKDSSTTYCKQEELSLNTVQCFSGGSVDSICYHAYLEKDALCLQNMRPTIILVRSLLRKDLLCTGHLSSILTIPVAGNAPGRRVTARTCGRLSHVKGSGSRGMTFLTF